MIDYCTRLEIDSEKLTDQEFLGLVGEGRENMMGIPLPCSGGMEALPVDTGEIMTETLGDSGQVYACCYKIIYDGDALFRHTWVLDRENSSLLAYCEAYVQPDTHVIHTFHGQELFGPFAARGVLKDDDGLPVDGRAEGISYSSRERVIDLMMREDRYRLPVIYLSATNDYRYLVDPHELAAKYTGFAHVLYETDSRVSRGLRYDTFSRNPYNGAAAVYLPGQSKVFYQGMKSAVPGKECRRIDYAVRNYMRSTNVPEKMSYLGIVNRKLAEENIGLQEETEAVYDVFGGELKKMEDRRERISQRCLQLERENEMLKKRLSAISEPTSPVLIKGKEREGYPGETRDIILDILGGSLDALHKGSRREQVVRDVIQANGYDGAQEEKKKKIKGIFRKNQEFNPSMKSELQELGFYVQREGKHIILGYQDCPQKVTIAKTPSDARSMQNLALDIIRTFF